MNKILIVGGAGYIGRSIIKSFLCTNYNITILDNMSTYGVENIPKYVSVINKDCKDIDFLNKICKKFDFVIWAVNFNNDYDDYYKTLDELEDNNFHMMYLSSTSVYDNNNMFAESDETSCTYCDDDSDEYYELMCENIVENNFKNYSIVRISNVYGYTDCGLIKNNFLNKSIFTLINKGIIYTLDEDMPICIIDVKDVGNAILKIVDKRLTGIINVGSGNTNWNILINLANKNLQKENKIEYFIEDKYLGYIDLSKIKNIGYKPIYNINHFIYKILKEK